jgi:transposase InsO family protein
VPRDHWLTNDEKERICAFAREHHLEGYRRLTFMMLDADVVACSPSSVYRVLKARGLLAGSSPNITKKGTGYVQPLQPHQEWHVDVSYLNIAGTFYFLCSILDGFSRCIVHQEIREKMEEADVEIVIQRGREKFPDAKPRIISDNGPQFIAKDFKEFIRIAGMTHVKTSPYYPQSNGKIERWHKTLKGDCIRIKVPLSLDDARRLVSEFTDHYNHVRLHSAIGYVTPKDKLAGHAADILKERDRKLAEARERRKQLRQAEQERPPTQPARPFIDFAAIRMTLSCNCSAVAFRHAAPNTAAPVPCTVRPRARAAASPLTSTNTSSTASNAAAPATPSTCGRWRLGRRPTMPPSTCANDCTCHCRRYQQTGTGKRKP